MTDRTRRLLFLLLRILLLLVLPLPLPVPRSGGLSGSSGWRWRSRGTILTSSKPFWRSRERRGGPSAIEGCAFRLSVTGGEFSFSIKNGAIGVRGGISTESGGDIGSCRGLTTKHIRRVRMRSERRRKWGGGRRSTSRHSMAWRSRAIQLRRGSDAEHV